MNRDADIAGVIMPPPLLVFGTLALALLIDGHFLAWPEISPSALAAGLTLVAAGLVPIFLALRLFKRAGTAAEPWRPSTSLVGSGIYRFTRNPMYVGMLTIYAGLALAAHSKVAALLFIPLFVAMDRLVVAREEKYLQRRFGQPYDDYRASVRRWL